MSKIWPRLPASFLEMPAAKKAGITEIRAGSSAPLPFTGSFVWPPSPPITGLEYDSRNIRGGNLYFALPGLHSDGHDFIHDAIGRGAAAVVHEKDIPEYREGVLYIKVGNSRFAMSAISDSFYGFPSRRMAIIGVTGTEGKSTTVYLIYQLLDLLGKKAGFISTVQHGDGSAVKWNSEHQTTPEAVTIHRLLAEMYENGAEYAVLESSSHGLSKRTNRLGDVDFDVGVMTTVTHEHLEFHGTWENYRSDKAELFRSLDSSPTSHKKNIQGKELQIPSFGVINADDPSAEYFAAATKSKTCTFSTKGKKTVLSAKGVESGKEGNRYDVHVDSTGETITLEDKLSGAFNAGNVLAALLVVSELLSVDIKDLAPLVPRLLPVRGRMSSVNKGQPFEVVIDYAHTPSSFETIFPPLRERLDSTNSRLISVFGSPGERDTQKRKLQGEIAARYSDIVILTDEDPRGEEPMTILEEIAEGCKTEPRMIPSETLFLIPNRPLAIRKAFSLARPGDLVLLLGKSHENSIIYAEGPTPYDEFIEAEAALMEAGYHNKQ